MKIFVYGTLLKGLERNFALKNSKSIGPAMLENAILYDLGNYPGIKFGNGVVIGEVYSIDERTLYLLDSIEDFNPDNITSSLYVRKSVYVKMISDGKEIEVQTYFYNLEIPDYKRCKLIEHGDYRRYLIEKKDLNQIIVNYGLDISFSSSLIDLDDKKFIKGIVEEYEIRFYTKDNTIFPTLFYKESSTGCPAIGVYVTKEELKIIDKIIYDKTEKLYFRSSIIFNPEPVNDTKRLICHTYFIHPDNIHYLEQFLKNKDILLTAKKLINGFYNRYGLTI